MGQQTWQLFLCAVGRSALLQMGRSSSILAEGVLACALAWNTDLPKQVYLQFVPNASEQQHPTSGAQ